MIKPTEGFKNKKMQNLKETAETVQGTMSFMQDFSLDDIVSG